MRDPARIKRISELLVRVWEKSPDLRLGQLISNLTPQRFRDSETFVADPYQVEDDDWERILEEILESP